jgi:hypothetical protein
VDEPVLDPAITPLLRYSILAALLVVLAGGGLFVVPERLGPEWLWELRPFSARFLGAVYLSEAAGGVVLVVVARWLPARVVLPVSLVFTGVVLAVSALFADGFDFGRRATWLWFALYAAYPVILAWHLWRYRRLPPPAPTPAPWRNLLLVQGAALTAYGVGLLLAPGPLAGFWPWEVPDFDARIYSSILVAGGVGALVLSRRSAPVEALTIGLTMLVLGILAVAGVVVTDRSAETVDWSAAGTWVWMAGFAGLAAVGGGLVRWSRSPAPLLKGA